MNVYNTNGIFMNNLTKNYTTAPIHFNTSSTTTCYNAYLKNAYNNSNRPDMKALSSEDCSEIRSSIEFRNLCSSDISELKQLCAEWFPVE